MGVSGRSSSNFINLLGFYSAKKQWKDLKEEIRNKKYALGLSYKPLGGVLETFLS